MRRLFFVALLLFFSFLLASGAEASLIDINKDGEVVWNVLAFNNNGSLALGVPERGELEIKGVASSPSEPADATISLKKEDDKVFLRVGSEDGAPEIDVTDLNEDLVEIEERGSTQKVVIGVADDKFTIEQNGIVATTNYPIRIDPKKNEISLETASGEIFLSILPIEAVETALRSKYVSRLADTVMDITQEDIGVLTYTVSGERVIKIFNIINYGVPVKAHISASTGEIIFIDQPTWLRILSVIML